MAAPTPKELELLRQFRANLTDLNLGDCYNENPGMELLRWIRARDHDLEQAEIMLRKHIQWRQETNYDQIRHWELPEQFKGLVNDEFIGYDQENSPIVFSHLGRWNLKTLIHEGGVNCFLNTRWKLISQMTDRMQGKLTSEGVPVTQACFIMDLEGFSIRQASLQVLRAQSEASRLFEANFPEILKITIIYNAPWFFPKIFCFIKPFLSQKTFGKIHIFGKDPKETREFMNSYFPANVLDFLFESNNHSNDEAESNSLTKSNSKD